MTEKLLVTYASYAGSTAEVAQRIGEILAQGGAKVDVLPATKVTDIDAYTGVVIGSPIHSGQLLPGMNDFVKQHNAALQHKQVAYFALALRVRDGLEDTRKSIEAILDPLRVHVKPVAVGVFAGKLAYNTLGAILRLQVQTKGLPEGDFRDWEAITAWATALREVMR